MMPATATDAAVGNSAFAVEPLCMRVSAASVQFNVKPEHICILGTILARTHNVASLLTLLHERANFQDACSTIFKDTVIFAIH
jgi:hypothetical protein